MAISSTLTKNTWPGNGVATLWPFHFRINEADHLAVIVADASGAETELDPSLYTVTGAGGDEGSVTYPLSGDPLPAGWSITLARRTPRKQETDLDNQGGLYLKAIERSLDGLTMVAQEQQELLDRAAKLPISSPESADDLIASVRESASSAAASAEEANAAAASAVADVSALLDDKVSAADAARVAAETALAQTLAAYDDFDDRYLGVHASDPTTDNDGNPLFPGALYFQQTEPGAEGVMKAYTGVAWVAAYVNGDSILTAANLLALLATFDATQQATARANIGAHGLDVEPVAKSASYTLALTDRGRGVDTSAEVIVPPNSSVAFPVGSEIYITNTSASAISITQGSGVTLRRAGSPTTGTYALAPYGFALLRKIGADVWMLAPVIPPIGVHQVWQDVTGSRVYGGTYTNTTGRPIVVSVTTAVVGNYTLSALVGGVQVARNVAAFTTAVDQGVLTFVVPDSMTYQVNNGAGGGIAIWSELR